MGGVVAPAVTALSIGIGCGTCCSPFVSAFLSTYIVSHEEGVKKSLGTFFGFFLGKLLGVSVLCMIAAGIGKQFLSGTGYIGKFPFRLAVQVVMSLFGIFMVFGWFREIKREKTECGHCTGCGDTEKNGWKHYPVFVAGVLYGISPCPPLILVLGYSASLSFLTAGITGICFGTAGILSPLLMLAVVLGVLSKRIRTEIPGFLKWFRLASYLLLVVLPFTLIG